MKYKKQEIGVMAFGTIQMAMTAVHLGDTDTAWRLLCSIAENNYYNTFSPSHNAGPFIFNCDISGGVPGLIFEMLIQSYPVTDENGKTWYFAKYDDIVLNNKSNYGAPKKGIASSPMIDVTYFYDDVDLAPTVAQQARFVDESKSTWLDAILI